MLYIIAIILLAFWLVGVVALHTVTGVFHVLLGAAVLLAIYAFIRGRRSNLTT